MADRAQAQALRTTYDVRSEQTGRGVVLDVPEQVAQAEAARLNAEAARITGEVPIDHGRPLHAGEQAGQGPTRYVVVERETIDERAHAALLEAEAGRAEAERAATDEPEVRERIGRAIEQLEEQVAELVAAGDEREQANRDAIEGLDRA